MRVFNFLTIWSLITTLTTCLTIDKRQVLSQPSNTGRFVFAHFMVGIVGNRASAAEWDADMIRAKAYGIDAFALNIGTDPYTDTQLRYAYASAAKNGMKVFISFDFNWWSTSNPTAVGQKIATYASNAAQLQVDGKVFVSSFIGDGIDIAAVRSAAGVPIYFAPNFSPSTCANQIASLEAGFNWAAWPNNGANRAASSSSLDSVISGDTAYRNALGTKDYIAPVSPWFFTHYGAEVSYSKNWLFPSDLLWYNRWQQMLTSGSRFIEIITWNDYGESHYVGPLSSKHNDDGASKWVNDMPHDGWLEMAKPFIAAYKAGATSVNNFITTDQIVYWYRPQPKTADCQATDNTGSPPDGWNTVTDQVFVVALLKSKGTVQVQSGSNSPVYAFPAPAGASSYSVTMGIGQQKFSLLRDSQMILSGTSAKDIVNGCVCGLYNFNAYVGTLPETNLGSLSGDGLSAFSKGLKSSTCQAQPSLGGSSQQATTTGAGAAATTTMRPTTMATSQASSKTSTATAKTTTSAAQCNAGSGTNNYTGLCAFSCARGYCPSPCSCTSTGTPESNPAPNNTIKGKAAAGLDSSYNGLCDFTCKRNYCPSGACQYA